MIEVVTYLEEKNADQDLFQQLVLQLEKDFYGATFQEVCFKSSTPKELVDRVSDAVYKIITTDASKFSNLLNRVDIPETTIVSLNGLSANDYFEQIVFLILKREWQKVWIRNTLV